MTIKLDQITLREIEMPLVDPFRTASGVRTARHVLLIELRDSEGLTAWSECAAFEDPSYMPETIDSTRSVIRRNIAPALLGFDFEHPRDIRPALDKRIRGNEMAKAAVEMAFWCIAAQRQNQSLARFIGGVREVVPTGLAIGMQPNVDDVVHRTQQALAEGYQRVKLKIGPGHDIQFAQAAAEAVGGDKVMLDANSAYTLDDVQTFLAMDQLGLMMIEQPLAWDDVVSHAALQRQLRTPICLDESLTGLHRVREMAQLGSGRIVSVKPGRVGGFSESLAIHEFCHARQIPVWCGGMLETGIGRAYNVALASLPGFTLPGDLSPSKRYWKEDIVSPAWEMSPGGTVDVPLNRPGLGVDIDEARIAALSGSAETLS